MSKAARGPRRQASISPSGAEGRGGEAGEDQGRSRERPGRAVVGRGGTRGRERIAQRDQSRCRCGLTVRGTIRRRWLRASRRRLAEARDRRGGSIRTRSRRRGGVVGRAGVWRGGYCRARRGRLTHSGRRCRRRRGRRGRGRWRAGARHWLRAPARRDDRRVRRRAATKPPSLDVAIVHRCRRCARSRRAEACRGIGRAPVRPVRA